jgi:hypothetical protein
MCRDPGKYHKHGLRCFKVSSPFPLLDVQSRGRFSDSSSLCFASFRPNRPTEGVGPDCLVAPSPDQTPSGSTTSEQIVGQPVRRFHKITPYRSFPDLTMGTTSPGPDGGPYEGPYEGDVER